MPRFRSNSHPSQFRSRGARRETLWLFGVSTSITLAAASTAILTQSLNAAALALRPFTVIRTIGELLISSDQVAADELQSAAFGLAVVSDQAAATGVAAVPTPTTDRGSDLWFVYQQMMSEWGLVGGQTGNQVHFDSKAMRKVEDGQDIVMVVESDIAAVTAGLVIGSSWRMLVKTH